MEGEGGGVEEGWREKRVEVEGGGGRRKEGRLRRGGGRGE